MFRFESGEKKKRKELPINSIHWQPSIVMMTGGTTIIEHGKLKLESIT